MAQSVMFASLQDQRFYEMRVKASKCSFLLLGADTGHNAPHPGEVSVDATRLEMSLTATCAEAHEL
jgi:hypothetical protein